MAIGKSTEPRPALTRNAAVARTQGRAFAVAIVVGAAIAYANSFTVPFIFDDITSIANNPTIRSLWPPGPMLSPPHAAGATVGGRPLLNVSFALNHAISGEQVWSYHLLNLLIHTLAGLCLAGVIRRSLLHTRVADQAAPIAGWTALLWTLHPVQTESVTYIVQRAESLNGLLYLSTLYAFIRGAGEAVSRRWLAISVVTCTLGMATKEVMVTAPVMVLAYDYAFLSGTVRAALSRRSGYYLALGSSWALLGALMLGNDARGGTAGFDVGVTPWAYAATQLRAVPHYLTLAFKPYPLVIDHGGLLAFESVIAAVPHALALALLVGFTLVALVRWPRWGFVGAWFLVILAPSSSVVPLLDSVFEHRMYLSLAAPLVAAVITLTLGLGRRAWICLGPIAAALLALTVHRNTLYQSDVTLWTDAIAQRPENARARFELGNVFLQKQQFSAAVEPYRAAIRLKPDYIEARSNLGSALLLAGRPAEALTELEATLRLRPLAETHLAAARCLAELGKGDEAIAHFDAVLQLRPTDSDALARRGSLHLQAGRTTAALADFQAVLALIPQSVDARVNLATALLAAGRSPEALRVAEEAVALQPSHAVAQWKLGHAWFDQGQMPRAIEVLRAALRLDPTLVGAQHHLARALTATGEFADALAAYARTSQLAPTFAPAHFNASLVLEHLGRLEPAAEQLEVVLRLQPDFPDAGVRLKALRLRIATQPSPQPVVP